MLKFFHNTYYALIEIIYYIKYIIKLKKVIKNNPKWDLYNLKIGYIYQIYFYVNLNKEDLLEPNEIKEMKLNQRIKEILYFLNDVKLSQYIYSKIKYNLDKGVALVILNPLFNYLNIKLIIKWLIIIFLLIYFKQDLINLYNVIYLYFKKNIFN